MASARAEQFRDLVRTARANLETAPDNPYRQVLADVAEGLTDGFVEARVVQGTGGRFILQLAPAFRPGRAVAMLTVLVRSTSAEILLNTPRIAATPDELTEILKAYVTAPEFLESLQEIADLVKQPVEGYLKSRPGTVSHHDVMLEVSPEKQRNIAQSVGREITLNLPISTFPGAGKFSPKSNYRILDSAGFTITLSKDVVEQENGELLIVGRVDQLNSK